MEKKLLIALIAMSSDLFNTTYELLVESFSAIISLQWVLLEIWNFVNETISKDQFLAQFKYATYEEDKSAINYSYGKTNNFQLECTH